MFKVNGKEVKTLKAVASELGKKRVDRKDLAKLGVIEVVETTAEVTTETAIAEVTTETAIAEVTTETVIIDVSGVSFKEFKDKLREYTLAELEKIVEKLGINRWEGITNEGIKRMRLTMELKAYYYPEKAYKAAPKAEVPVSPWKAISTEKLIAAAKAAKLEYKPTENEGILRMRIIMKLKAANIAPESI